MDRLIREDPTTGWWTVISPERMRRPVQVAPRGLPPVPPGECPFCPGHEHMTGPTIAQLPPQGSWRARAVPNKYPAVRIERPWERRDADPYRAWVGFGAHEVLIESPEHDLPLWAQDPARQRDALRLARDRLRDLHGDLRLAAVTWFRNRGADAGASQAHPHAQVVGLPEVPRLLADMVTRARAWRASRGVDLLDALLDADRKTGDRIVAELPGLVALCPYAPMAPFEVWLVPAAGATFRDVDDASVDAVADLLSHVERAQHAALGPHASHVVLATAPREGADGFRWHLRVRPRLEPGGGFEAISASGIVSTPPEEAAQVLRGLW